MHPHGSPLLSPLISLQDGQNLVWSEWKISPSGRFVLIRANPTRVNVISRPYHKVHPDTFRHPDHRGFIVRNLEIISSVTWKRKRRIRWSHRQTPPARYMRNGRQLRIESRWFIPTIYTSPRLFCGFLNHPREVRADGMKETSRMSFG